MVNQNGPVRVFENRSAPHGWIGFRLQGARSNRDGIGARVWLHVGSEVFLREARAGASFFSAHDPRLLFGLGERAAVDSVVVEWPSGLREVIAGPEPGRYHEIVEGHSSR